MKAIVFAIKYDKQDEESFQNEIDELKNLAYACNIDVVSDIFQSLSFPYTNTYFGTGKLDELKIMVDAIDADVVICNDELSSLQISNLSEKLKCEVYDRTYLILEIFRSRARTKEAQLQVEIARLSYLFPRIQGMNSGLSRQRGAGGGFAHGKGAGESKAELEKRINTQTILALKRELKELTKTRKLQREKRKKSSIPVVSLVGYTNAGKSTIMNRLLEESSAKDAKKVFEKDMLFATLETQSRKIEINNVPFILTDTVGFIDKLPHNLVEAFKSTLEEIKESDLIIHVIDISNRDYQKQYLATNEVLESLEVKDIPTIYCFNKIDKVSDEILDVPFSIPNSVYLSAKNKENIDLLVNLIFDAIYKDYINIKVFIPFGFEKIKKYIYNNGIFINETTTEEGYNFKLKIRKGFEKELENYIVN